MSRSDRSGSHLNLEQQRKRAKDLRRAHGEREADAAVRIIRHLPRARSLTTDQVFAAPFALSEAQLVVAREAGFASWPVLKHFVESSPAIAIDRDEALIDAAFAGRDDEVRAAIEHDPEATRRSIGVAAAVADLESAWSLLDADHTIADRPTGRRNWKPLAYLCCSAYRRSDSGTLSARLEIATRLIELGADVNERSAEPGYVDEEWWPLGGAAERVASPELVRLLIASGASVLKTPAVLSNAVRGGNLEVLQFLLELSPPGWYQVIWALKASVQIDRIDLARVLIAHAAHSTAGSTKLARPALMEAIRLERATDLIDTLLGEDTSPLSGPIRTHVYRYAIRCGNRAAADAIRRHGVDDNAVTTVDQAIGACLLGVDRPAGRPRQTNQQALSAEALAEADHRMLAWAVRRGHHDAVPCLLDLGLDPNVADTDGELPLHLAVRAGRPEVVDTLIRGKANVLGRNFDGETPLEIAAGVAAADQRETIVQLLVNAGARPAAQDNLDELFERAADAVAFGDLDTLRALLDKEPALADARSPRPHRCTLLNYVGANGTEDPRQRSPKNSAAVAELLLERGANPNATCNLYGGGSTTLGLLLTSMHPPAAGVDGDVVAVMARFGATVDQGALMGAIEYGLTRSVAALVDAGVPIDNLFSAAGLGRLDVIDNLLASGADINERFPSGGYGTALHAAAGMGHAPAVQYLLERGADRTLQNRWEATPADAARHFNHRDVASMIETFKGSNLRS